MGTPWGCGMTHPPKPHKPSADENLFQGWSEFCLLAAHSMCKDPSCKCGCHEVSRNVREFLGLEPKGKGGVA
jgi:hypothetical protein